jgi:hypothetical protein
MGAKNMAKASKRPRAGTVGFQTKKNKDGSHKFFRKAQIEQILFQQNGKCAICKKKINIGHAVCEHRKPWADRGRKITVHGRILHLDCVPVEWADRGDGCKVPVLYVEGAMCWAKISNKWKRVQQKGC